jgi:prepilin-type N-terminal cleavage/methylation domain-containing protein
MTRQRAGMTLIEILIVMTILATLAAVLYPAVATQIRKGQATALADQLTNLREAISNYQENVAQYPTVLTQLTNQPLGGETDLCGVALSVPERNAWRGPYLAQNIVGNMPAGDATILNDIIRNPLTNGATPPGILQIKAINVDSATAADLEVQFDGPIIVGSYSSGTILWTTLGFDTLTFQMLIRNC